MMRSTGERWQVEMIYQFSCLVKYAIDNLQSEREDLLKPSSRVCLGALFSCNFGDSVEYFFFASAAGGQSIVLDGYKITVITAQSPLAGTLMDLKAGDNFSMPNGSSGQILTVE